LKIESLKVKNYRTLGDITISFDGYYTAISGKNNAGKTSLIKVLIQAFKDNSREYFIRSRDEEVDYDEDKTQWVSDDQDIEFIYSVKVDRNSDPGLFGFVEKFYSKPIDGDEFILNLIMTTPKSGDSESKVLVNGDALESFDSTEVVRKLSTSNLAFIHDSSDSSRRIYASRRRALHELLFSLEEKKQLQVEQKKLQNKIKSISKSHRSELSELLGHLEDSYDVDFTLPEGMFTRSLPFGINLKDKNVDVPLEEWGSGTKNRTKIMMSILQANRIRTKDDENRITPVVIIEEPESFLHPSAQAEFGRVLIDLANELKIQTIVTTHSPYMLCQHNHRANVLLERKVFRKKLMDTVAVELNEDSWMTPFSDNLGLNASEFDPWKKVISQEGNCLFLCEGELDKEYLKHISSLGIEKYSLPKELEIVPYKGKDALKNTVMLNFILRKFNNTIISFDLDAKRELQKHMEQLSLVEKEDYFVIGLNQGGKECIEGLVPGRVTSKVFADQADLVMQLQSQDTGQRKSAKSSLKAHILTEFKKHSDYTEEELKHFKPLFSFINKNYKR
jgi:predicted ATP-dependent endonuclease of OLD family